MIMKKLILTSLILLIGVAAGAQGILNRFTDPEKGHTVFIPKGNRSIGISGAYRSFNVGGEDYTNGDGYAILSYLNIGNGKLNYYNVTPSFSYFIADDLALGFRLEYSGYTLDSDLKLDVRNVPLVGSVLGNISLMSRHMTRNAWGGSISLRKYLSFFGSRTIGLFGEARLYGNYGVLKSCPIVDEYQEVSFVDPDTGDEETEEVPTGRTINDEGKMRISTGIGAGLKLAAGMAIRLKDNSAITLSIPIVGANYSYTKQNHAATGNQAHMSQFGISRDIDFLAIQVGYTHYITSKKRK